MEFFEREKMLKKYFSSQRNKIKCQRNIYIGLNKQASNYNNQKISI